MKLFKTLKVCFKFYFLIFMIFAVFSLIAVDLAIGVIM
jgi:hypothetical protein